MRYVIIIILLAVLISRIIPIVITYAEGIYLWYILEVSKNFDLSLKTGGYLV